MTLSKKQTEDFHVHLGRDLDDLHFLPGDAYRDSGQEFASNIVKEMPTRINYHQSEARKDDITGRSIAQSSTGPNDLKPMGANVFTFEGAGEDTKPYAMHDSMKPRQGLPRRGKAVVNTAKLSSFKTTGRAPPTVTTVKKVSEQMQMSQPGFQNAALSEPFTIKIATDDGTAIKAIEKKETKMLESLTAHSGHRNLGEKNPYEVIHLAKIDPLDQSSLPPEKTIKIEVKKAVGQQSKESSHFDVLQATLPKTQKLSSAQGIQMDLQASPT